MNYPSHPSYSNYWTHQYTERIRSNDPSLTKICVKTMPLLSTSANEIVSMISALQHNTCVKSMELTSVPPSTTDPCPLSPAAPAGGVVVVPSDNDNNKDNQPYAYLHDTLVTNTTLTSLTLREIPNTTSSLDITVFWDVFAQGLTHHNNTSSIRLLTLGNTATLIPTPLSYVACQSLCHILQRTTTLESLRLINFTIPTTTSNNNDNNNNNDDDGLAALCRGIQSNRTLLELHLHHIEAADADADADDADSTTRYATTTTTTTVQQQVQLWKSLFRAMALSCAPLRRITCVDCDLDLRNDDDDGDSDDDDDSKDDNEITTTTTDFEYHPLYTLVTQLTTLDELKLLDCQLGCTEWNALCHGLQTQQQSQLRVLDVSGCDLLGESCHALASVLKSNNNNNTQLRSILLSENILGDYGIQVLSRALAVTQQPLHILDLQANHITDEGCYYLAEALSSSSCAAIHTLNLSENAIGTDGAIALGVMLCSTTNRLQVLNVNSCCITSDGVIALCHGLEQNTFLHTLNLSHNQCTSIEAGNAIHDMLTTNTTLKVLDLSACQINDVTLSCMVSNLSNTTLQTLDVSCNAFGNVGVRSLAHHVIHGDGGHNKNCLATLNIQFIAYDDCVLQEIATALSTNYYLETFLYWNGSVDSATTNISTTAITTTTSVPNIVHHLSSEFSSEVGRDNPTTTTATDGIEHYLSLNRAGLRALTATRMEDSCWPQVLKHADQVYGPSALYSMLRERPELFLS